MNPHERHNDRRAGLQALVTVLALLAVAVFAKIDAVAQLAHLVH